MSSTTWKSLLIAVLGTLFAVLVHLLNAELSNLPSGMHETADDPSYLRPAENFLDHGTWKENTTGNSSYVQRPPLSGFIHLIFYAVFGNGSLIAGLILSFLLHGISIYCLPGIMARSGLKKQQFSAALIYSILPCFWGFLSYSITESIAASLIILTLSVFTQEKKNTATLSIFMFALIWLLRPVLIMIFVFALIYKLKNSKLKFGAAGILLMALAIIPLTFWEIRKANYMEGWPGFHPIYHETNETMFRPVHRELSDFFRIWETKPEDFHSMTGYYWSAKRELNDPVAKAYYQSHSVPIPFGKFDSLLCSYSEAENNVKALFGKGKMIESKEEIQLSTRLRTITSVTISKNRFLYSFKTPVKSGMEMLTKSQLNLELFQAVYNNSIPVKGLKIICIAVIAAGFLGCFLLLFKGSPVLRFSALGTLAYLFYLFWFQRMNEERYLIPVLPVFLIALLNTLNFFLIRKQNSSKG